MVNPFGDTSESPIALQEKIKQMEFQVSTLRSVIAETKIEMEQIKNERDHLLANSQVIETELSEVKQQYQVFKQLAKERGERVGDLEASLENSQIPTLKFENERLKEKLEDAQSELARSAAVEETPEASDCDNLYNQLIPLMLQNYDPENDRYSDAFQNLVELCINEGNVLNQVVAILVKYGGSGPRSKVRSVVKDLGNFDVALDILTEQGVIVVIDDVVQITTVGSDMTKEQNWSDLDMQELVNQMKTICDTENTTTLVKSFDIFRDILQERDVSGTIFFEIRKLKETVERGNISRKEVKEKITLWEAKLIPED
jgi:hypothetical protein